jgi:predicted neuraminidase
MVKTSGDNGQTWSHGRRLPDGILGPIKNKPIALAGGDILSPSSTESDPNGWRVHFERSSDGGEAWTATPPVNDGRNIDAIQPDDEGKTWGQMSLTSLPNPSAGIDAVTLADGRHLLVYNPTTRGNRAAGNPRGLLTVAISTDGKDWKDSLVLERSDGEFSYPAVIQTDDGLVHITYTWKRERIKHVVVDPDKLRSE